MSKIYELAVENVMKSPQFARMVAEEQCKIERRLENFHFNTMVSLPNDMREFLTFGPDKKIQAIKKLREFTNWSLKDSKDYVDMIANQLCRVNQNAGVWPTEKPYDKVHHGDLYAPGTK